MSGVGIDVGTLGTPVPVAGALILSGFGMVLSITGSLGLTLPLGADVSGLVGLTGVAPSDGIVSGDGVVESVVAGFGLLLPVVVDFLPFLTLFFPVLVIAAATVETCEEL
jgi:hypothetical protein